MGTDNLITISEAAKRAGVHRVTMHNWIREGRIEVVRIGGRPFIRLVDAESLERLRKPKGANANYPLEAWVMDKPFEDVDEAVSWYLDRNSGSTLDFERWESASDRAVYRLSQSDLGDVGEIEVFALSGQTTEILFSSIWGFRLTDPTRRDKRNFLEKIAIHMRPRLFEGGWHSTGENTKPSPEMVQRAIETKGHLDRGLSVEDAVDLAGLSRTTYIRAMPYLSMEADE